MFRLTSLFCIFVNLVSFVFANEPKPNVVIVIADDQGYGDLGHTGNPIIQTPNIDALAAESTSLTDYHVAPTCSPTRAALMTGHWTDRTGVWHTINGRSMLRANEVTLGQLLKDNGYSTGMFGSGILVIISHIVLRTADSMRCIDTVVVGSGRLQTCGTMPTLAAHIFIMAR